MATKQRQPIEALPTPAVAPLVEPVFEPDEEEVPQLDNVEADPRLVAGSQWFHKSRRKMVTLLATPDSRGKVPVTIGDQHAMVSVKDLSLSAEERYRYWWQGDNLSIRRINPGKPDETVVLPHTEMRRLIEAIMDHPSYDEMVAELSQGPRDS